MPQSSAPGSTRARAYQSLADRDGVAAIPVGDLLLAGAKAQVAACLPKRAPCAAVYGASPVDDLSAVLSEIARHHKDAPLTDEELAGYIWT